MQIVCPACGVSTGLSTGVTTEASQDAQPEILICSNCQKRIRLDPLALPPESEWGPYDPELVALAIPTSQPPKTAKKNPTRLVVAIAIIAIAAIMVTVLALVAQNAISPATPDTALSTQPLSKQVAPASNAQPWDRANRNELVAMKSQADALAIAGKWQPAFDAYQQILKRVADHPITDPVVSAIVNGTHSEQDQVMQALIASRDPARAQPPGTSPSLAAPTVSPTAKSALGVGPNIVPSAVRDKSNATQPAATLDNPAVANASTQPTTGPVVQLDPVQDAADHAPPMPGTPPLPPSLKAYRAADSVSDAEIGEAIANGVTFLRGQFQNAQITTNLHRAGQAGEAPPGVPQQGRNPAGPPQRQRRGAGPNAPAAPPGASNLDDASDLGTAPTPPQQIQPTAPPAAPWAAAFSVPGVDALCVYALLHSGQALNTGGQKVLGVDDPFVQQILEKLKSYRMEYTYHRSLRAAALAVFNRSQDTQSLEDDVRWLLAAGPRGAYTYTLPQNNYEAGAWDNSNSQYGLLGVWSGAQVGMSISQNYWHAVIAHWAQCANGNGTFGYTMGDASTTMTCAGIASLLVARDYADNSAANARIPTRPTPLPALDTGLNWMDEGDNCMTRLAGDGMGGTGYGLYGLERVGLASGYKYFGRHDWYSELARILVAQQHQDGSWGVTPAANGQVSPQTLIDTAYALLFLARGRHPILYNKLRYEGDWNDRPNDVSHLTRFAAHALERPLNWQVVNLRRNWFDWMDCPVLYISGDRAIKLAPQDYMALRDFANGGGMIFTHADGGSGEFNKWVTDTIRILFPKYELMTVPRDHPVYSMVYPLKNPPPLLSINNGSRTLLVHSPTDLAGGWQQNWTDERKTEFQLGVNLFVYAAGKGILKNRLASNYIPPDPDRPDGVRQIARLEYAAEWDPEPYAWTRFSRFFQWETHLAIEPVTIKLKELAPLSTPASFPLATLTGTVRHDFTPAECQAAKSYVQSGGILLIDACGGSAAFNKSIQTTLLPAAFPDAVFHDITAAHPLLVPSRPGANDLSRSLLRSYANQNGGKDMPLRVLPYGKGWVLYSPLDITTGLLGTQAWGILGYDPAYAQSLMKNAVLWAKARAPQPVAAAKP